MNNRFSKKNKLIYKMKCLNGRNEEYKVVEDNTYDRIEKYNEIKVKKWKYLHFFSFFAIICMKEVIIY